MQGDVAARPSTLDSLLLRVWAMTIMGLLLLSWKLWIPGFTDYPRVPILVVDNALLPLLHYLAGITLATGLVLSVISDAKLRFGAAMIAAGLGISFLINQHCLQPWAWQTFIIATLLACLPMKNAKKWLRWLMISIYLYSAIGKFDYQFVNSLGREFLGVIYQWLGLTLDGNSSIAPWLVLGFPAGEFLIGVGLCFRRTRHIAAVLAILLHLALIAILSPVGLGHRWPVIVWNGLSIALVGWLFLATDSKPNESQTKSQTKTAPPIVIQWLGVAFAMLVLLGPMLRPLQYWDHWLAWGLYSPSNSRVELFFPLSISGKMQNDQLENYLRGESLIDPNSGGMVQFALDQYTLDELGVPIYPQARFQKTLAIELLQQQGLLDFCRLDQLSASDPRTGERTREQIDLSGENWRASQK